MSREELKSLDTLLQGDATYGSFVLVNRLTSEQRRYQVDDFYRGAKECQLNPSVPDDVANLFLGAQYSYIFAWFVYRLHPVAQTQALVCLEFGLKKRFAVALADPDPKKRPRGLKDLLEKCVNETLVRDSDFRTWPGRRHGMPGDSTEWTARALVPLLRAFRNDYAHGSAMLMPDSWMILSAVCDWLNRLFPVEADLR